jgi:hypothetical protein
MAGGTYSVETRTNQSDYSEQHEDFNSPEEVKNYIKALDTDEEHVHSVLFYPEGTTCNPKDVTKNFR